jgi:hypothetical protein
VDLTSTTSWRDPRWRSEAFGPEDRAEPFERVVFARGPAVTAVAGHEPYWRSGGPDPYHDSYTVPVFTREDVSDALVAKARVACAALRATIAGIHRGSHRPRPHGLTHAVRRALRWISPTRPR